MDETSTFFDNCPVLTGAAVQVADEEAFEGVDVGDKEEVVAKATEPAADLKGKMIPVKGRRIGLAGDAEAPCSQLLPADAAISKGATAAAAKAAWWRAALSLFFNFLEGPRCFTFTL